MPFFTLFLPFPLSRGSAPPSPVWELSAEAQEAASKRRGPLGVCVASARYPRRAPLGAVPWAKAGWRCCLEGSAPAAQLSRAVKHEAGCAGVYFPLRRSRQGEGACEEEIGLLRSTSALQSAGAREGRTGAEREIQEESMRESGGGTRQESYKWRGKAVYMYASFV